MSRTQSMSGSQLSLIAPLMRSTAAKGGRPFNDHPLMDEDIAYRYRTGTPW